MRMYKLKFPSELSLRKMLTILALLFVGFVVSSEVERRATYSTGMVSQACLECICKRESGCRAIGCRMDVGSLSCGYFQIKENYWIDCGRPGGSWKTCADDLACASKCVQSYMQRYVTHYHCPHTCEGYAREHNGGPNGCHHTSTVSYWHAVQGESGCSSVH